MSSIWATRMKKETELLKKKEIPHWIVDGSFSHLRVSIAGPPGTPYAGGVFTLDIQTFERYPFSPPKVRFATKIYHPNVDDTGMICLSILVPGTWKPSFNLLSVIEAIKQLMAEPNGSDALTPEIGEEFLLNPVLFNKKAKDYTDTHAKPGAKKISFMGSKRSSDTDDEDTYENVDDNKRASLHQSSSSASSSSPTHSPPYKITRYC